MRDLKIALGNSRQAKIWSNKTTSFEELCKRLETPIRTTETAEEYPKLPKGQRDEIKDKGGFVGGHLRDNLRKVGNVDCRSLWTPDIDHATPEFVAPGIGLPLFHPVQGADMALQCLADKLAARIQLRLIDHQQLFTLASVRRQGAIDHTEAGIASEVLDRQAKLQQSLIGRLQAVARLDRGVQRQRHV